MASAEKSDHQFCRFTALRKTIQSISPRNGWFQCEGKQNSYPVHLFCYASLSVVRLGLE
jgi:hypothetical protein